MRTCRLLLAAPVVALAVASCAAGGPMVTGDEALENVAAAVQAKHGDQAWFEHVERVSGGPIADMKVHTDLDASRPADMAMAIEVCEAYAEAIVSDSPYVLVYGTSTESETRIDGKVVDDVFENAKLARAVKDDDTGAISCIEGGVLR